MVNAELEKYSAATDDRITSMIETEVKPGFLQHTQLLPASVVSETLLNQRIAAARAPSQRQLAQRRSWDEVQAVVDTMMPKPSA